MNPARRTFTAPGNRAAGDVDVRLTTLVQRLSARPGLHHVSLAVASTDGQYHWAGGAGPGRELLRAQPRVLLGEGDPLPEQRRRCRGHFRQRVIRLSRTSIGVRS
jgi:hypothetical protein